MKNLKNFLKNWYYGVYKKPNLAIKNYKNFQEAKHQAGVISEKMVFQKILGYKDSVLFTNYLKSVKSKAEKFKQALEYDKAIEKWRRHQSEGRRRHIKYVLTE